MSRNRNTVLTFLIAMLCTDCARINASVYIARSGTQDWPSSTDRTDSGYPHIVASKEVQELCRIVDAQTNQCCNPTLDESFSLMPHGSPSTDPVKSWPTCCKTSEVKGNPGGSFCYQSEAATGAIRKIKKDGRELFTPLHHGPTFAFTNLANGIHYKMTGGGYWENPKGDFPKESVKAYAFPRKMELIRCKTAQGVDAYEFDDDDTQFPRVCQKCSVKLKGDRQEGCCDVPDNADTNASVVSLCYNAKNQIFHLDAYSYGSYKIRTWGQTMSDTWAYTFLATWSQGGVGARFPLENITISAGAWASKGSGLLFLVCVYTLLDALPKMEM